MENLEQEQVLSELLRLKNNKTLKVSEILKELVVLPFDVIIDDWNHYTILEKLVFLVIWSPLLWIPLSIFKL